jgi:hypothetical protein
MPLASMTHCPPRNESDDRPTLRIWLANRQLASTPLCRENNIRAAFEPGEKYLTLASM